MTIIDTVQATHHKQQIDKLYEQKHPDVKELEAFLKIKHLIGPSHKFQALELKYQAMTTVPTTIEKTMSPYQLYASNSPLWAVELNALNIESFLDIEKNKGKLSKTMFERTYAYETQGVYSFDIETFDRYGFDIKTYKPQYTQPITISKKG